MSHSNVYIRGIPVGFDTEALRYLFETYGSIVSVKILEPRHQGDKRLGFVKFSRRDEAVKAISAMNGYVIAGQSLEVREAEFDVDPKKNVLDKALVENDNLFVRGFPSHWTADQLTEHFSKSGVVVSVRLLSCTMPERGGVGLVRYSSLEEARRAVVDLNASMIDGFGPITVKYSTVKEDKGRIRRPPFRKTVMSASLAYRSAMTPCMDSFNNDVAVDGNPIPKAVLLCNLPETMTELRLYREFAPYGAVSSVNIGLDENQKCSGMAFVNYIDGTAAVIAARNFHGAVVDGYVISAVAQS